jgi:hypothetical protein
MTILINEETLQKIITWLEDREPVNAALALKHLLEHSPQVECPPDQEQQFNEADTKASWFVT